MVSDACLSPGSDYTQILKRETASAIGCTEPVAVAYAVAKAKSLTDGEIKRIHVQLSRNMMKNAMGVGIPGTGMAGIDLAAALGAFGGDADAVLEVLHGITPEGIAYAKGFAGDHVSVVLKDTPEKLYIEAEVESERDKVTVVIRGEHTNITSVVKNGIVLCSEAAPVLRVEPFYAAADELTVEGIFHFIREVPAGEITFLFKIAEVNWRIAQEGLEKNYGLRVGRTSYEEVRRSGTFDDARDYASSLAAAAADARMAGCMLPVMTLCGSGNQGITAMVPVIALCDYYEYDKESLLRALALSCLVTIHVKRHIGKLSPICGCGLGSAIGVSAAVAYLRGGAREQIVSAIKNVIADISGIICDGAKAGCALKVATVVNSAFMGAKLALRGLVAGSTDGIVSQDVETCIRNIGRLGNEGMKDADRTILDIMQRR